MEIKANTTITRSQKVKLWMMCTQLRVSHMYAHVRGTPQTEGCAALVWSHLLLLTCGVK